MRTLIKYLILIFTILILDQASKIFVRTKFLHGETYSIIEGFFSFTYVKNPGVAFGFMADMAEVYRRPLLLAIPILACIWLAVLVWQTRESNKYLAFTYSLIFSGALGNFIDRLTLGFVVDFFDFYYGSWHYPAFNVADSAISIAACLLILDFFLAKKLEEKP